MDEAPLLPARRDGPLLGLGQISLDRLLLLDRLPGPGGKQAVRSEHTLPGGQVATALLAAARLGVRCAFAGAVGDDPSGGQALAPLAAAGVDLRDVHHLPGVASREALVLVERESGERAILERRPSALRLPDPPLPAAHLDAAALLLVDLEHPEAARWAVARAAAAGVPVLMDVDRISPLAIELLGQVEFPIVSEGFADEISSGSSLGDGLRALAGPRARLAVVTCGRRGSLALWRDRLLETHTPQVRVVDTTGAGDVFRGAFAWALLSGAGASEALAVANTAAALSCRGLGAQGALPTREEIASHRA